jgi:hypothetical protein
MECVVDQQFGGNITAGGGFEGLSPRNLDVPMPPRRKTEPEAAFDRLRARFGLLKAKPPENFETGISIRGILEKAGFISLYITYVSPSTVIFRGHCRDGSPAQLLMHLSKLNVFFYSSDGSKLDWCAQRGL